MRTDSEGPPRTAHPGAIDMERHTGYHLVRAPERFSAAPVLDDAQRAVVEHLGGPLLVLAGPGTGKTTTIVEAVAGRVERGNLDPERILVLTFSRKAAEELRERITSRLGRTLRQPLALTFHSYAYALVRREFVLAGDEPPTLLPGPEQLLEVRRLLRGDAEDGGQRWPERLRPALPTRGFAAELRDFLLRACERGLNGRALARLGAERGRDDWVAAGDFLDRYAARFDLAPVPAYDYAEIVRIAAGLLDQGPVRERERKAYDAVFVDEYQDTDPAQEWLLYALAGDGRELVVVGDPDQSIYAFRGADVGAIARFGDRFRAASGEPASVVCLRTCRRSGPVLLRASRRIAGRLPAAPLAPARQGRPEPETGTTASTPPATRRRLTEGHRDLVPQVSAPPGAVRIITATSPSQEAALVADVFRRAHLIDGVPWSDMALLVRSVTYQVPLLRRALSAAGVPVDVAGDELPLTQEPGTRPLIQALTCALRPAALDEDAARDLLTGPLGGADSIGLRRLRRALLAAARASGEPGPAEPLASALRDPRVLITVHEPAAAAASRVATLLALVREKAREGSAHDVLWALWDACGLARGWQAASAAGGSAGAAADRDLDAVVALFDAAARFTTRLPPGSPGLFLESLTGQEIAGDTLAQQAPQPDAVRILTAHRSKGLEWDVVVVAGVQDGVWPDVRTRSSLLGMDELVDAVAGHGGVASDAAAAALAAKLVSEERRLFYVAVTRARRTLVVTAAGGPDSDERPSRFLTELAGDEVEIEHLAEGGRHWLSLPALTADLRRTAADPHAPPGLRHAAARQIARLAAAGVRGAHPRHWYALTDWTGLGPVFAPPSAAGEQAAAGAESALMRISPSQVSVFARCGLRWLLEVAVGAGTSDVVRHFGVVIHAAAVLAATGAADSLIGERLDEIWPSLDFGSAWYSEKQREQAQRMVTKFLAWHRANPRELLAVEQPLRGRIGSVEISGRVDRLERDDRGRAVIVDLKTGSAPVPGAEVARHPQLGIYQLAVLLGAFERFGVGEPGGAELVQLGKASLSAAVRVQHQGALSDDGDPQWARELVETVAAGMASPVFEARRNPGCRNCPVRSSCPAHPEGEQVSP